MDNMENNYIGFKFINCLGVVKKRGFCYVCRNIISFFYGLKCIKINMGIFIRFKFLNVILMCYLVYK